MFRHYLSIDIRKSRFSRRAFCWHNQDRFIFKLVNVDAINSLLSFSTRSYNSIYLIIREHIGITLIVSASIGHTGTTHSCKYMFFLSCKNSFLGYKCMST